MDEESMRNLRLDKRLARRRGWVGAEELERELQGLPDAADKIKPVEEDAPAPEAASSAPGAPGESREPAADSASDVPNVEAKIGGPEIGEA